MPATVYSSGYRVVVRRACSPIHRSDAMPPCSPVVTATLPAACDICCGSDSGLRAGHMWISGAANPELTLLAVDIEGRKNQLPATTLHIRYRRTYNRCGRGFSAYANLPVRRHLVSPIPFDGISWRHLTHVITFTTATAGCYHCYAAHTSPRRSSFHST